MRVRTMEPCDLEFAASCTAGEGWMTETREEFGGYLASGIHKGFVAEGDDGPVGIVVATFYGECGFIGDLIVARPMRRQGIGRRLLAHGIRFLQARGAKSIRLDGVPRALSLYERAGFRRTCRSLRFSGLIQGGNHTTVRPMTLGDMSAVVQLDKAVFGADRGELLRHRLDRSPSLAKVATEGNRLTGYILGRRRADLMAVGPWVAVPGGADASRLLESLAGECPGLPIVLGVLETNKDAVDLVRSMGLNPFPAPPWRMTLGQSPGPGGSPQCLAIASSAVG